MKKIGLLLALLPFFTVAGAVRPLPNAIGYKMETPGFQNFETIRYGNPFSGNYRSILEIAPEINGKMGIRLPVDEQGNMKAATLELRFSRAVKVLVGVTDPSVLAKVDFHKGKLAGQPVMLNALSITELPAMDVYAVEYRSGKQQITVPANPGGHLAILGVVASNYDIAFRDAGIEDQENYEAFYIEGFAEGPDRKSVV